MRYSWFELQKFFIKITSRLAGAEKASSSSLEVKFYINEHDNLEISVTLINHGIGSIVLGPFYEEDDAFIATAKTIKETVQICREKNLSN